MEPSLCWEANRFSAQEILRVLWNPKVHYLFYKYSPPVPILRQNTPVHAHHPTSWRSILMLSSHLRLGLPSGLFPWGFPTKTIYTPGRIILKRCLKKWTELMWLRVGINGKLLWTRQWTFGFYNVLGVSWLAAELLASQERLCSADFVRGTNCIGTIVTNNQESWHVLFPNWCPLTMTTFLRMDF